MNRCRHDELYEHLKSIASGWGLASEQLESDLEEITLSSGGGRETASGVEISALKYRGIFYFERLPKIKALHLAIMAQIWLLEHDELRGKWKLPDPSLELIELDRILVDARLSVEFVDIIYMRLAKEGEPPDVVYNNNKYMLEIDAIVPAEHIELANGKSND